MLNLSFMFDDAVAGMTAHAEHLRTSPLAATVYMMQLDVINHYRRILDEVFVDDMSERCLLNSSHGAAFPERANKHNAKLAYTIAILLRYTSRLAHETKIEVLMKSSQYDQMKTQSNFYTCPICGTRDNKNRIGFKLSRETLEITSLCTSPPFEFRETKSVLAKNPTFYLITTDAQGGKHEREATLEEYMRNIIHIRLDEFDIRDRWALTRLKSAGEKEVSALAQKNRVFGEACNAYYKSRKAAEPFNGLIESWMM
jgi:hypothetical protein